ncbi:hypothetical protein FQV26_09830 [Planococcus sp. CPCC 101016]|uniref:hypothetical protein n=1 Tax=Planococcus sp. CPCC 101016 TaxID=2599617 RepID=UPI0011B3BF9C|nr:hypothetical protein [Planococcus sp. CPCC 101016]TWT08088.1 hypothetical protein FQV26_09830 [Planococcus sp. CPCC 101016]
MTKRILSVGSGLFLLLSYLQPFTALFTDSFFVFGITPSVVPVFFPLIFAIISLLLGLLGVKGKVRNTLAAISIASIILHLSFSLIIVGGA